MTESGRDCLIKNTDNNNNNNNKNNNNIKIDRYCLICLDMKNWYMYTLYSRRGFLCFCTVFHCVFFLKAACYFFYYAVRSTILGGSINFFYKYFSVICNILAPWIFNDYSRGICDEFVTIIFNHSHIS
jgi:hypothetical protein